jgi:hypothetical protein
VSTPSTLALGLRGGLVGAGSVLVATAAHAFGGGGVPQGGALVTAALACAIIGALAGEVSGRNRRLCLVAVVAALCVGQVLSHVIFAATGHHHAGMAMTPSMAGAHAGAAVALGAVICAAEYLYVVGATVLSWLRLFATAVTRPLCRPVPRTRSRVVVTSTFPPAALGMRAPPVAFAR